jgi:hypothetical protein
MARRYKAFVSSTFEDLKEHRAHVIHELRQAGVDVDPMEDWTAASGQPKEFCQQRVEGCDFCILLVGFRRGYRPEGEGESITQFEYSYALKKSLCVLTFLLDDDAPWYGQYDERKTDPGIVSWREELKNKHGTGFFGLDPQSINIAPAITRWLSEQQPVRAATRNENPIIGLRFPGAHPFRNREQEIARLREHLQNPDVVLTVVIGPAGVGKTALVSKVCEEIECGKLRMSKSSREKGVDGIVYFTWRSSDKHAAERLFRDMTCLLDEQQSRDVNDFWADAKVTDAERFEFFLRKLCECPGAKAQIV